MRKDDSNVRERVKHTRNAGGYGKRGVNKRVRKNAKQQLQRDAK
jgi:hypothetical protein